MTYIEMGIYFGGFLISLAILFLILGIRAYCVERKEKAKDDETKEILSYLEIP